MLGIPSDVEAVRASGVLTAAGLAAVAAEPSLPPLPPLAEDVAVGRLVRDRLGDEVADRLVEPLLGGVYAGRADDLSLRATVGRLAAHLAEHGGSLLEAAARGHRRRHPRPVRRVGLHHAARRAGPAARARWPRPGGSPSAPASRCARSAARRPGSRSTAGRCPRPSWSRPTR